MYLLFLFFAYCGKFIAMEPGKNENKNMGPAPLCICSPQNKKNYEEKKKIVQSGNEKNNVDGKTFHAVAYFHNFTDDKFAKKVRKILVVHSGDCNINHFLDCCFVSYKRIFSDGFLSVMFKTNVGGYNCELIFIPYKYYKLCERFVKNVDLVINLFDCAEKQGFYSKCEHAEYLYNLFVKENKKFLFFCGLYDSSVDFLNVTVDSIYKVFPSISMNFDSYMLSWPIFPKEDDASFDFKMRLSSFLHRVS